MEERTLDKENGRKIRLKKTADGEIDALEETENDDEAEISLDFDEVDEDLAGLSPEETEEVLKKREKAREAARAERDKLLEEAEQLLAARDFLRAESYFSQALLYDPDHGRAREAVWICRTENYRSLDAFYDRKNAKEFSELDGQTKKSVLSKVSGRLEADKKEYQAEKSALEGGFLSAQEARRKAFRKNRNYYLLRFSLFFGAFVLFLTGALVSVFFITRTRSNLPIILAIAFGAAALLCLLVTVLFSRKLFEAQRFCSENEKMSSTEDGARLQFLQDRLACLELVLGTDGEED